MDHSLHVGYEDFTHGQGHPLGLAVHEADYQGHIVGNYDGNSYLTGPFTEQGAFNVSYETWCGVPYAPENATPFYPEASACWAGTLPEQRPELLYLHAPVPLLGRPPLLRNNACYLDEVRISAREERSVPRFPEPDRCPQSITPPQSTFPTPSELLVGLSNRRNYPGLPSPQIHRDWGDFAPAMSLPPACPEYSVVDNASTPDSSFAVLSPGDSDTTQEAITPHEKKRYYLECLEHYVIFLHEHCRLISLEPPPLERVSNYRCLNSRSIRSLLIHMEKLEEQMKRQILQEEQRFLRLRDALQQQEAAIQAAHEAHREV